MPSRPLWKGQLRLSLVAIPVELHSATRSGSRVSFRQIHKPSGKPVRHEKVARGVGPVKAEDIVKGYEYEKDKYVLIDPDEVDAIKLESKKTFELVQFVGSCEISPLYFDKPYYLVPADDLAEDAYRVVRDALRETEMVGVGQITLRGKEYLASVKPCGDGLLLETLHYADDIRKAAPYFADIEDEAVDADLLEMATALIAKKTAPFDASAYHDKYVEALRAMLDSKLDSKKTTRVSTDDDDDVRPSGDNVLDLMAALKKSLAKSGGSAGKKKSAAKKAPAKRTSTRKKSAASQRKAS